MQIKSSQIIYSEHHYDECFEYKNGSGRVPEGTAIGYEVAHSTGEKSLKLILFDDIKYSEYDHDYWDNYELENDADRVVIP
tara:strand:- start:400 stop:642 length:243 start_codon:yes stop_codon:yes gene_type:complete